MCLTLLQWGHQLLEKISGTWSGLSAQAHCISFTCLPTLSLFRLLTKQRRYGFNFVPKIVKPSMVSNIVSWRHLEQLCYSCTILIIITSDSCLTYAFTVIHQLSATMVSSCWFVKALSLIYGWQPVLTRTDMGFSLWTLKLFLGSLGPV